MFCSFYFAVVIVLDEQNVCSAATKQVCIHTPVRSLGQIRCL